MSIDCTLADTAFARSIGSSHSLMAEIPERYSATSIRQPHGFSASDTKVPRFRNARIKGSILTHSKKRKPPPLLLLRLHLPLSTLSHASLLQRCYFRPLFQLGVLVRAVRLRVASRVCRFCGVDEVVVWVVRGRAQVDVFEVLGGDAGGGA